MRNIRKALATGLAALLTGSPMCGGATPATLGVVVEAEHARLGGDAASEGTTVYEGDQLSTEDGGSMQVRVGAAIVRLKEKSSATIHKGGGKAGTEITAELESGAAVLSTGEETPGEIVAKGAKIQPVSEGRGVVEVRVLGSSELQVTARKGSALVSYRGESGTIAEGKSCLVMLGTGEEGGGGGSGTAAAPGHGKALWIIPVAAAVAVIAIGLKETRSGGTNVESPDRP